jgi:hypothetical protein
VERKAGGGEDSGRWRGWQEVAMTAGGGDDSRR